MGIKNTEFDSDLEFIEKVAKRLMQEKLSANSDNGVFDFNYCVQKF
jgi:hypothetical protein